MDTERICPSSVFIRLSQKVSDGNGQRGNGQRRKQCNKNSRRKEFAHSIQAFVGAETKGYSETIQPLEDKVQPTTGGSTDVAEVTRMAPGVSLYVATAPEGLPWHSWATASSHGRPNAHRAAVVAAKVLAMTAADFMLDKQLRERATAEFEQKIAEQPYVSPIPKGQKPLLPED